jgi:hypothetical protein
MQFNPQVVTHLTCKLDEVALKILYINPGEVSLTIRVNKSR